MFSFIKEFKYFYRALKRQNNFINYAFSQAETLSKPLIVTAAHFQPIKQHFSTKMHYSKLKSICIKASFKLFLN